MSLLTYLNPDAIKDASIEGIKLKDGSITSSKIDSSVASTEYVDNAIANIDVAQSISITWSDLKAKRDAGQLTPGMQYRITDYQCTTVTSNTKSAGHQFDIIVVADDERTLNETARAIKHPVAEGGTDYFADNDLSTWQIWYCLDNDTTRFAWADSTNGKGVIYRMIDEWNNDVPYDFKNIQFKRYILNAADAFATNVVKDGELDVVKEKLKVMPYRIQTSLWYYGEYVTDVYPNAEKGKKYVPFGDILYNSDGPSVLCPINEENFGWFYIFSDDAGNDNTLTSQGNIHNNVIKNNNFLLITSEGEGRHSFEKQNNVCLNDIIFIGNTCSSNSFGSDCCNNTFGNNCYNNSFGIGCYSNTFGSYCYSNTFGNNCNYNTFDSDCGYNTFGSGCGFNTFGSGYYNNSFGSGCGYNTFGSGCGFNTFGNNCNYNTFGNNCNYNTFGDYYHHNSFGNNCSYIKFASDSSASTEYMYYRYNRFGDGCKYILFKGTETASISAQVQNYNFAQGLQGTEATYLTVDGVRNRTFETKVAQNSNGELKIYCEADLIR